MKESNNNETFFGLQMSRFFANLFAKAKQNDAAVMTRYREKQAEMASKMHEKIRNPSNKEIFKAAIGYYEDPSPKKMNEKIYKKMPKVNPGAVDPTSGDNSFGRLHQLKVLWTVMFAGFGFIAYTKYQERKSRISRSKKIQTPLFKAKGFKLARYKNCIILEDAVKNGLVESIEKFQLRDSDVICASFPKSGTTWLQQVVYLLMHPDEDGSQKEGNVRDTLEHRVPYIEYPYPGLNEISKRKDPRIIKTHLPQHLLPTNGKGKVIYIVRDPKDVMVSYYFFARMLTQMSFEGNLEDFALQMMQDRVPYGPYFDHLVGFKMAAQAEDQRYLIVKYENMKKNPKTAIKEIAEFLDIKTSEELLTKIEKETSFDKMKSNPVTNYQHWDEWGLRNPEESEFMRKGQVGDHKNHFSPELQDSVSKWVQTNVENYPMIKSLV